MAAIGYNSVWSIDSNALNIVASNVRIGSWKGTTNVNSDPTSLLQATNFITSVSIAGSNIGIGTTPKTTYLLDVGGVANIATLSLSNVTANTAPVLDSNKHLVSSAVTSTELGYLSGVTSSIQTQLNTISQSVGSSPTGAITTVYSTNLTASKAVISDASGKLAASVTTSNELAFLSGVTSSVQTQLNSKLSSSGGTISGDVTMGNLTTGQGASTGPVAFEHGNGRTGAGNVYIDLHSEAGTDYDARIIKYAGSNGDFWLLNKGTGAFILANNNAEAARFDTNGNFGIGTTIPQYKLHVTSDINTAGSIRTGGTIRIDASGTLSNINTIPVAYGGLGISSISANKVLVANTGGTSVSTPSALHWDNTNTRLGVNETSPIAILHATAPALGTTQGNSQEIARFTTTNTNASHLRVSAYRHTAGSSWTEASTRVTQRTDATDQGYIEFNSAGTTGRDGIAFGSGSTEILRMTSLTNGANVGIGTTDPSGYKLNVQGTIHSSGAAYHTSSTVYQNLSTGYYMSQAYEAGFPMGGATFSFKTYDNSVLQTQVFFGNGKVGIGTNSTTSALGVNGNINANSITINNAPSWTDATLANSWVNFNTTTDNAAGYMKDPFGRVFLRGLIMNGTVSTTAQAFTLPSEFLPPKRVTFAVATGTFTHGEVRVTTDGKVCVASGNNAYVSLEGINFSTN